MSLELFPPRSKVSDSSGTITPEFYRGLRELVRRVGGSATSSLVTMAEFLLLKARVLAVELGITALDLRVDALDLRVDALEVDVSALQNDVSVLQSNQVLTKQTIIDLGSTYVFDKTINVIDADVTVDSLMTAQIAPIANGYTRPIEEVIYEKITIQPMPKAGSIDFYIQPQQGHIKGLYAITYTVAL